MLFLKSTVAPVAPGIYAVDIAAKPPGTTFMLYAAVDGDAQPTPFIEAIENLGFKQVLVKPYVHHDGKNIVDLHFQKVGSDIFDGWTGEERETNLREVSELLAGFKIEVAPRVMSLAEAFR